MCIRDRQYTGCFHADRRIARAFSHQRFFSESIAGFQFGQRHIDAADLARNGAATIFNDVVEIAFVAFTQDDFASIGPDPFKTSEQFIDTCRRQTRQRLSLIHI